MNTHPLTPGSEGGRDARHDGAAEQARLALDIADQRRHVSELVQALENKLSPGGMLSQVLGPGKDGGREFARHLGEAVKANPVPTVLTAAGLIWLYAAKDKPATHTGAGPETGHEKLRLGDVEPGFRDRVSGRVGQVKERATEKVHRAEAGLQHMLEDNPMAVGAMAIAAGALLGALLPETRKEKELLGEASARFTGKARELGARLADAGKEATQPQPSDDGGIHRGSPGPTPGYASPSL